MGKNKAQGCIDVPAENDQFKIEKYIDGLSEFICECDTPMTIAIQGDWGTGKTSIMNMILHKLKDSIPSENIVWFNTWQFSQFDLSEQLPLLLVSKFITALGGKDQEAVKNVVKQVFGGIINITAGIASQGATDGSKLTDVLFENDFTESYTKLSEQFQKLVKDKAKDNSRVVIFVDDLDRLAPGKAVELLEVMKNFLDCQQCVFVLAIDYGVVLRGVKEKYGADFDEEKGRSFFDKIIQVPFRVPVSSYNIKEYVKENFSQIGVSIKDDELLKLYVELIENSIGNNPRSMKRLFNSFLLLRKVAGKDITSDTRKEQLLFALLCMQSKFADVYDYLIRMDKQDLSESVIRSFLDTDFISENFDMDEDRIRILVNFTEIFYSSINVNNDSTLDETEIRMLKDVLDFSAITQSGSDNSISNSTKRDTRKIYFNSESDPYPKSQIPTKAVNYYVKRHEDITVTALRTIFEFPPYVSSKKIIAREDELEVMNGKRRYSKTPIKTKEGNIYVWSDWGPSNHFDEYMRKLESIVGVEIRYEQ